VSLFAEIVQVATTPVPEPELTVEVWDRSTTGHIEETVLYSVDDNYTYSSSHQLTCFGQWRQWSDNWSNSHHSRSTNRVLDLVHWTGP